MEIRHAEQKDVEEIHNIALKTWKDTYKDILPEDSIEEIIEEWYDIESLREEVKDPIFYVAEENGSILGFVHVTIEDRTATLHRIYLDPAYQGEGIGSELYRKAEEEIEGNADRIKLEVFRDNKSGRSFYRKHGFDVEATEKVDFKGNAAEECKLVKEL